MRIYFRISHNHLAFTSEINRKMLLCLLLKWCLTQMPKLIIDANMIAAHMAFGAKHTNIVWWIKFLNVFIFSFSTIDSMAYVGAEHADWRKKLNEIAKMPTAWMFMKFEIYNYAKYGDMISMNFHKLGEQPFNWSAEWLPQTKIEEIVYRTLIHQGFN